MPLAKYIEALKSGEDFMLRRLFHYATTSEYTRYTSTKEEEWRMTLREPAKTLLAYLHDHEEPEMIHVDEIFEENPAAAFGILEAQRHRRRGIKFDMFLAMAKYVRQCFVDLIYEISLSGEETKQALAITHRFFDKFELGFSSEWVKQSEKELIEELQQTNRILTNEKNRYLTIFQSMAEPVFVVDNNMQLVVVNKAFEKMTGVSNQGFLGKVCTEVLSNPLCPACPLKKAMKESSSFADTEINLSINGADKTFLMSGGFLDDISGKYPGGVAIIQDITDRKRAEEKIKTLLAEKELLLREVHHRIKNNMLTMMAMLTLQAKRLKDSQAVASLGDAKSRLQSMYVLYDKLYRTENLREMSIRDYLPALVDEILDGFPNRASVKIETRIDDFMLGAEILSPLGIIVNELLTNAMKCAFIGREDGLITVSAAIKDHRATIVIEDNGIGLPESIDLETSCGFGLQLVGLMTKQIYGTIKIERREGARFVLEFEVYPVER